MKTLSLLLLLAVQGGIAQNKPQYSVDLSAPHASKKIAMSINLSDTQQNHYYSVNFGVEVPGKITSEVEVSVDGRRIFTREQTQARLEWVADGFTRDIARNCTLEIIQAVEFGTKDKSLNYVKDACAKPSAQLHQPNSATSQAFSESAQKVANQPLSHKLEELRNDGVDVVKPELYLHSDKKSDQDEFHGGPTKTCSRNPYALDACTPQYPLNDGQVQEVSRPDDVYHDTNVSSDKSKWKIWPPVNWDGASRPPWEKPAPQPLVEKAVEEPFDEPWPMNKQECTSELSRNVIKPGEMIWKNNSCHRIGTVTTCPKRPGFHVFLLPDESTGEKMCVMLPKEK